MKDIVILYHKDCLDGYGAAWAAHKLFGEEAEYIPVGAGMAPPELPEGVTVYCVDIAFRPEHLEEMAERYKKVVIIDHHETAVVWFEGYDPPENVTIVLDQEHSAAILSWEYFHKEKKAPELLKYIEDRDLWKWELPDSESVLLAVDAYPYTFGNLDRLVNDIERLKGEGQAILKYRNQMLALQLQSVHLMEFDTEEELFIVPVVNCSLRALVSEACHDLLKIHPDAPFVAAYRRNQQGAWEFSLRSGGNFDVAAFANAFAGGGGHKQAAGMTLDALPPIGYPPVVGELDNA